jgi:hypothetical protein
MKKILLIICISALCICSASCLSIAKNLPQNSMEISGKQPEQSAEPLPEETAVALVYMDTSIDMFISVNDGTWKYTKEMYPGEVYFYPGDEDPAVSPNGFAISSQPKSGGIEAVWESWEPSLEQKIEGFDWNKEQDITVGNYTGSRYHFTASAMVGDHIFWETDKLLYICSLSSDKESYDANYALLADALGSFKTLGEVQ